MTFLVLMAIQCHIYRHVGRSSQKADKYLLILACRSTMLVLLCKYCIRTGHHEACLSCRARAELARIFAKIIETRRATGSSEDDMLQVSVTPIHSTCENQCSPICFAHAFPLHSKLVGELCYAVIARAKFTIAA